MLKNSLTVTDYDGIIIKGPATGNQKTKYTTVVIDKGIREAIDDASTVEYILQRPTVNEVL